MATIYSEQLTVTNTAGNSKNDGILDDGGKTRILFFNFLTTGVAQNDTVNLGYLPKNARILNGSFVTEALGASVTISVGTDTALTTGAANGVSLAAGAANLVAATSVASAATVPFAATYLLGNGAKTTARTLLYMTVAGATPTTAKNVQGWVKYVQN